MPSQEKPVAPVAAPVVPAATEPVVQLWVELQCVSIESMEKPVTLVEDGHAHVCLRRTYTYKLEHRLEVRSHPKMTLVLECLEPQPFEEKKVYAVEVRKA